MAQDSNELMDKLVALCKRRGFIFQSSEIYGGINGFWDYGPLGVELKRNVKEAWWEDIVRRRDDMVGLDCSIIMNPKVWEASGHVVNFNDPLVDCKQCKAGSGADKVFSASRRPSSGRGRAAHRPAWRPDSAGPRPTSPRAMAKANSKTRRRLEEHADTHRVDDRPRRPSAARPAALCPLCGGPLDRRPQVQHDVQDLRRRDGGFVGRGVPAAGNRPGHLRQLQERAGHQRASSVPFGIAQIGKASATRSTRGTSPSAAASSSRWRSSSSAIPTRPTSGTHTGATRGTSGTSGWA